MREMKDSGVEWIGKIPSDWKHVLLKYVCKFKTGGTPKNKEGIDFEGEYPWITANDFNESLHIRESKQKISHESVISNRYSLFPAGSTLLVCIASVGKVGIIEQDSYSNQQITALKPLSKIVPKFLMYATVACSDVITFKASSNVVPIINTKTLGTIAIPIQTLTVQTKIADFLDHKCSEIDALTADIQTQIETLKEYKKSVITEAVTKGLDPNVEMKDSGIEWIGQIYKDFAIKRIKYSFNIFSGGTPNTSNTNYWDGDIPWLTPADFKTSDIYVFSGKRNITKMGYQNCSSAIFPKNSIIFSKRAPIGTVALAANKLCINQGCFALVNKGTADTKFYYYVLSIYTTLFDFFGSGTTFKEISALTFKNIVLPCPPITEQHKIADFLDQKCSEIDQTISEKQQQLETLAEYKKSLIYEYVTGKKEVA